MENPEKVEKTVEKSDFQKRADEFLKQLELLKNTHRIDFQIQLDFPEYKILPNDLQLALAVISKHKMTYVLGFKDTEIVNGNKS